MHPLLILLIGIFSIVVLIAALRLNAFLALIVSALLVSLLAPGEPADKITRVASAFGATAGGIGIVIALAVVIGRCMMDSGAADRIVRGFLSLLGRKRCSWALMSSGFVLSIPVFFDTVFYLLVPLARSTCRRTGGNYLKYATAVVAGGVITHSLVPPTPGPLIMADQLGIDLGMMILVGMIVAIPCALVGLAYSTWIDRRMQIPMRPLPGGMEEADPLSDEQLPPLPLSLTPILLPVLLVSMNTIVCAIAKGADDTAFCKRVAEVMGVLGNVNFAMLLSTVVAMGMLKTQRRLTNAQLGRIVETSLMSGGMIILITAAGGAFGAMLQAAQIGPAIETLFAGGAGGTGGVTLLVLAALITCIVKVAQGSGTVAMITASAMIAAMAPSREALGYPPVLLATAIGGASMMGSWMNDSGFWIFVKMSGLTEAEGLKCWTPLLAVTGFTSVVISLLVALLFTGRIAWWPPLLVVAVVCVAVLSLVFAARLQARQP